MSISPPAPGLGPRGPPAMPSVMRVPERSEETERLSREGATILCLGCPQGLQFGIDHAAWQTGPLWSKVRVPVAVLFSFPCPILNRPSAVLGGLVLCRSDENIRQNPGLTSGPGCSVDVSSHTFTKTSVLVDVPLNRGSRYEVSPRHFLTAVGREGRGNREGTHFS